MFSSTLSRKIGIATTTAKMAYSGQVRAFRASPILRQIPKPLSRKTGVATTATKTASGGQVRTFRASPIFRQLPEPLSFEMPTFSEQTIHASEIESDISRIQNTVRSLAVMSKQIERHVEGENWLRHHLSRHQEQLHHLKISVIDNDDGSLRVLREAQKKLAVKIANALVVEAKIAREAPEMMREKDSIPERLKIIEVEIMEIFKRLQDVDRKCTVDPEI